MDYLRLGIRAVGGLGARINEAWGQYRDRRRWRDWTKTPRPDRGW